MAAVRTTEWQKLPVSLKELCINTTLRCGQSFRWRRDGKDEWTCSLHGRILSLRQDATHLHYRAIFPIPSTVPLTPPLSGSHTPADEGDDTEELIRYYFNLNTNLTELYEQWSSADVNFKKKAPKFTGIRILNQDPWEALVGFICSSNNNIIRISQMVDKLCKHYGPLIGHIDTIPYHDFPSASALTAPTVESHLRQLGFGYRAKYLHQTALMIVKDKPMGWLDGLRNPESPSLGRKAGSAGDMKGEGREGYRDAHDQLIGLQGVGPKVADCICLFGLGWGEAVPVDTHVWQIAQRDYKFGKGKHKSLTKTTYDAIGNHFRSLWGKEAGWAHSVLFTADLRAFSEQLASEVKVDEETTGKVENSEVQIKQSLKAKVVSTRVVKRELDDNEVLPDVKSVSHKRVKRKGKR